MIYTILESIRYTLTLLFGIFVSALFLDIRINKKNVICLFLFFYIDLVLQGIFYFTKDLSAVISLYPFITHLPLLLFFVLIFKKRLFPSLIAITSAYLCCQISNWTTIFVSSFIKNIDNITYSLTLIISFVFIIKFVYLPISQLLKKQSRELISFGIIPIFYYIFDYLSTVYTKLLYIGNKTTVEFTPFLLCICYFVFCTVYFKQYEEKQKIETTNKLIYMKQAQSKKEMKLMEENEKKVILMRHDMRHFLNNILNDLENNQNEHAIEYIHTLFDAIGQTVRKKYCLNDTVNMIMTSYENRMKGLENAFKAVMLLENERFIELNMQEKCGKLLISIENNYLNEPIFIDGIPISKEKDHGFGTQSIAYTVEKLHGNCQFSTHQHHFKLRVVI